MDQDAQRKYNARFVERFLARRPNERARYEKAVETAAMAPRVSAESAGGLADFPVDVINETIVNEERPVLFVRDGWIDKVNVTLIGIEAKELVNELDGARSIVQPLLPLVGRIDVQGFLGNLDYVGTGWFIAADVIVTNRHVANLIAQQDGARFVFSRGVADRPISVTLNTAHEFDDLEAGKERIFEIKEVLYIERPGGPNDIAFLRAGRTIDGARPGFIGVHDTNLATDAPVVTIGYPAKAPKRIIPDQVLMKELYRDRYDVKRAAPGLILASERSGAAEHDCTTLGGASGSPIVDPKTGKAAGLHFAGLYKQANYAVPASALRAYVRDECWRQPVSVDTRPAERGHETAATASSGQSEIEVTIPVTIKVSLGQAVAGPSSSAADVDAVLSAFWDKRPDGVIAARIGFVGDAEAIGDTPCIAASVVASRLQEVAARGPSQFLGVPVKYFPADVAEQVDAEPEAESVDSIAYDDGARTGPEFSFTAVDEEMTVRAHVGPEYSWDELNTFLSGANGSLVSAIYEFHAPHIKNALENRLKAGTSLTLIMDNLTFSDVKDEDHEFDRIPTFAAWANKFGSRFKRIVALEGKKGLISDAYHIKVTVRDDDVFWLSSGNWKAESSQPVISQQQRDNAPDKDLPGNREWHVVIHNQKLARLFRSHILQDFKYSADHGAGVVPKSKMKKVVELPLEETIELERRPPETVLEPLEIKRRVKVRPLLTPDDEGAVYSEAVLDLIRSARKSLLFQIPYIGMPSNPRQDRGYIDELIKALTEKLKSLEVARVILRTGGDRYSDPTHAAWYFKSKGVNIAERLRRIDDHHTKGMIVDGKSVLIGSHNWSKPGVTLNRDASLIFDDKELAGYYARAFQIDWKRSNPIKPRRFAEAESVMLPGGDVVVAPRFRRVNLQDLPTEG